LYKQRILHPAQDFRTLNWKKIIALLENNQQKGKKAHSPNKGRSNWSQLWGLVTLRTSGKHLQVGRIARSPCFLFQTHDPCTACSVLDACRHLSSDHEQRGVRQHQNSALRLKEMKRFNWRGLCRDTRVLLKAFERLIYRENERLGLSHSKEQNKQQHRRQCNERCPRWKESLIGAWPFDLLPSSLIFLSLLQLIHSKTQFSTLHTYLET